MIKADTCRHFTGLANKVCQKGIQYEAIKVPSGIESPPMDQWAYPCMTRMRRGLPVICLLSNFPTPEEERADEERLEKELQAWTDKLKNGICPHCDQKKEWQQVGRCVYCSACGARLYQGKLKKQKGA